MNYSTVHLLWKWSCLISQDSTKLLEICEKYVNNATPILEVRLT